MRKLSLALLLFLSVTSISFSQEINELDFLTSGKWLVESVQIGEEVQEFPENSSWMIFHADGKYEVMMSDNEKKGNWKLEETTKVIRFEGDDGDLGGGLKIELLNKKELLFSATESEIVYTMKLRK